VLLLLGCEGEERRQIAPNSNVLRRRIRFKSDLTASRDLALLS
jgi:hypothetical protein